MEDQAQSLIDATTAAFKAGRLPGGATIPPPAVRYTLLKYQIQLKARLIVFELCFFYYNRIFDILIICREWEDRLE